MSKRNSQDIPEDGWYDQKQSGHGLRVADTFEEVKNFAYSCFDALDKNGDGFVSRQELDEALRDNNSWDWRDRSYICFLLRRLDDIKVAYHDENAESIDGISRADIQEYFKMIRAKLPGA